MNRMSPREASKQAALPPIVSNDEWLEAREALLVKEKELTRALDALAAERRRLPMVRIGSGHAFEGPEGKVGLGELFAGRRQLIVYQFMWHGVNRHCAGCSGFTDNIGHLAHLHARDTSLVLVSDAPFSEIEPYRKRMGWSVPWYSALDHDFSAECGVAGGSFGLSILLRDGDRYFRTYFTTSRGVDRLRIDFNLLDLTPYGRQETWEDSPEGWPQTPPYGWIRLHDEYE